VCVFVCGCACVCLFVGVRRARSREAHTDTYTHTHGHTHVPHETRDTHIQSRDTLSLSHSLCLSLSLSLFSFSHSHTFDLLSLRNFSVSSALPDSRALIQQLQFPFIPLSFLYSPFLFTVLFTFYSPLTTTMHNPAQGRLVQEILVLRFFHPFVVSQAAVPAAELTAQAVLITARILAACSVRDSTGELIIDETVVATETDL